MPGISALCPAAIGLREKARIPRPEERGPTLKGGDEWPSGLEANGRRWSANGRRWSANGRRWSANGRRWSATQPPSQDGFFFRRTPVRKHGVLHPLEKHQQGEVLGECGN
jgi:hypothetical protein